MPLLMASFFAYSTLCPSPIASTNMLAFVRFASKTIIKNALQMFVAICYPLFLRCKLNLNENLRVDSHFFLAKARA